MRGTAVCGSHFGNKLNPGCCLGERKWLSTKNRSPRRSTPRHPIAMESTAKPPDPMPCALTATLLQESRAYGPHKVTADICRKPCFLSLSPSTFMTHGMPSLEKKNTLRNRSGIGYHTNPKRPTGYPYSHFDPTGTVDPF